MADDPKTLSPGESIGDEMQACQKTGLVGACNPDNKAEWAELVELCG